MECHVFCKFKTNGKLIFFTKDSCCLTLLTWSLFTLPDYCWFQCKYVTPNTKMCFCLVERFPYPWSVSYISYDLREVSLANKTCVPFASFEVVVLFGMATVSMGMKEDFKDSSKKLSCIYWYNNALLKWLCVKRVTRWTSTAFMIWSFILERRKSIMISCKPIVHLQVMFIPFFLKDKN